MNEKRAKRILARTWIESAVIRFTEDEGWENYPDIGQYDYEDIENLMGLMVEVSYPKELVEEAYGLLMERAERNEDD